MFQGAAALNLDAKGRLAVPARHRDALAADGTVILTAHPHRCLMVCPSSAWNPIRSQLLAASSLDYQSALIRRMFVGMAREEEIDAAGRVLVAPELREFAQLEKEVRLVGQGNYLELWSDAGWKKQQEAVFALGDKLLPPSLQNLAL